MRFFIGKRIYLPVVGGLYTGVSFGGFHHSHVLMPPPGSGYTAHTDHARLMAWGCALVGLASILKWIL